ncbi:MAG: DNA alkylation repair protein [Candidatus Levybacteria bacterium]|nr:DNA alkylation repair protein [Candidatus Levybacteria bacterium]
MLLLLKKELHKSGNPKKAKFLQGFFKTGKGEYGEGDVFIGVTVPESRKIAQKFAGLSITDVGKLITSKIHEERLVALLILVYKFQKGNKETKKEIFDFYLAHTIYINNWDLVDLSARDIVGSYLFHHSGKVSSGDCTRNPDSLNPILAKLARSKNLWERRIAIIATYYFVKRNQFNETLKIAALLTFDQHDLIHKAVGWMLREVGKRDQKVEEEFLKNCYKKMPRTALRYAIERFPKDLRLSYLNGFI